MTRDLSFLSNESWLHANKNVLNDFCHVWPRCGLERVRWDSFRGVFIAKNSHSTYTMIHGKWAMFRRLYGPRFFLGQIRGMSSLSRWSRWLPGEYMVPSDAMIWFRWQGAVMFVASAASGRIVKLVKGEWFRVHMQKELEAWKRVSGTDLAFRVPAIYDYKMISDDRAWICMDFVPNSPPVFPSEKRWISFLRKEMLPYLSRYYEFNGLELLSALQWVALLKRLAEQLDTSHFLNPVLAKLDREAMLLPNALIMRSIVHGDLKPENVHIDGERWWLFDWSADREMTIMWDVVSPVFFHALKFPELQESKYFWRWIGGESAESMPKQLEPYANLWQEWLLSWKKIKITPEDFKFHILGMCVEWYLQFRAIRGRSDSGVFSMMEIS